MEVMIMSKSNDKLSLYLTEMSKEDAQAVELELLYPVLEHTKLAEILTNHGYPISEKSVRRARKSWEN
jgi:hypothetical protein